MNTSQSFDPYGDSSQCECFAAPLRELKVLKIDSGIRGRALS